MVRRIVIVGFLVLLVCGLYSNQVKAATSIDVSITWTPGSGIMDFTITYVSDTELKLDWSIVAPASNIMIRAKYSEYPDDIPNEDTAPSDGYLVYYGNALTITDTSMNFNETPGGLYYRAWGQRADGKWIVIPLQGWEESARMVTLTASILFLGMACLFSILGHLKREWWFSTIGILLWLVVGFWWVAEGVDTLYNMSGGYTDIIYWTPFFLSGLVACDIINYWNQIELKREHMGVSWTSFGTPPKEGVSSYEAYKREMRRRVSTTQRRSRG